MTMAANEPVVSGRGYTVTEVDGRPQLDRPGCVGERVLTLVMNGLTHRVHGTGMERSGTIRFHQEDLTVRDSTAATWPELADVRQRVAAHAATPPTTGTPGLTKMGTPRGVFDGRPRETRDHIGCFACRVLNGRGRCLGRIGPGHPKCPRPGRLRRW